MPTRPTPETEDPGFDTDMEAAAELEARWDGVDESAAEEVQD